MEEQKKKMQLPKITRDDFFTTQEERDLRAKEHVENLKISDISDFPNHPFKVIVDADMREMANSIAEYGVLVPVLVRPKQDGKYEMISGHRRKKALEILGIQEIEKITDKSREELILTKESDKTYWFNGNLTYNITFRLSICNDHYWRY